MSQYYDKQSDCGRNAILPLETVTRILSFFEFHEMIQCRRVSTHWKTAVSKIQTIHLDLRDDATCYASVNAVTTFFDNLANISIANKNDVNPFWMQNILSKHSNVEYIRIDGDYFDADVLVRSLHDNHAANLKSLELEHVKFDDFLGLNQLLRIKAPSLNVLRLIDIRFHLIFDGPDPNECVSLSTTIGKMQNLEVLVLDDCDIQYFDAVALFSGMARLRKLEICNPDEITLVMIARCCPRLEELTLRYCFDITPDDVIQVVKCCPIRDLTLEDFQGRSWRGFTKKRIFDASSALINLSTR
mmetsp:Transcript_13366/g.20310  ORF Transcript_13366/g.20310 Transcript_13366/m.20310 type:complete len:301 (+) Transcript_13366:125-1027(+)